MIGTALGTCQGIARNVFCADWTHLRCPASDAFLIGHRGNRLPPSRSIATQNTSDELFIQQSYADAFDLKQVELMGWQLELFTKRFSLLKQSQAFLALLSLFWC